MKTHRTHRAIYLLRRSRLSTNSNRNVICIKQIISPIRAILQPYNKLATTPSGLSSNWQLTKIIAFASIVNDVPLIIMDFEPRYISILDCHGAALITGEDYYMLGETNFELVCEEHRIIRRS